MTTRTAKYWGIDISTSAVTSLIRDAEGNEDFTAIPMRGRTSWHDQPAFDHEHLPQLLLQTVVEFEERGWQFEGSGGCLVISIRQHDLTLLDAEGSLLGPAITWECSVATEQEAALNANEAVVAEVGPVAARMLTPKCQWLLTQQPDLKAKIAHLMTTGDWINFQLTGELSFGSSDGLSNAQLNQETKKCATTTITAAGLEPAWQPPVVPAGSIVGTVRSPEDAGEDWLSLIGKLQSWRVGSPLGDNNAGALGMGVHAPGRLALSAGSSGTAIAVCDNKELPENSPTKWKEGHGAPLQFEFFSHTMLLTMLHRCALAYDAFCETLPTDIRGDHGKINQLALEADLTGNALLRVTSDTDGEHYPEADPNMVSSGWSELAVGQQIASMQMSVAAGLLSYAQDILLYLGDAKPSDCVLTGGLSQSPFFQAAITAGMETLAPDCQVFVSSRTGPSRFQAAARGALMAAMLPDQGDDLAASATAMEQIERCPQGAQHDAMKDRLASWLSE